MVAVGLDPEVVERARRVQVILLDVDGVLTDGRLYMSSDGTEGRTFYARDGLGIRMGQGAGLSFGILSGRESPAVTDRAAELNIDEVHQSVSDKAKAFGEIAERLGLPPEAFCFMGDDLVDIPVMRRVGFAVAPADAVPEALEAAHHVTRCPGGGGAVRETIDLVLRASGHWNRVLERYRR